MSETPTVAPAPAAHTEAAPLQVWPCPLPRTLAERRSRAAELDEALGMRARAIEEALAERAIQSREQTWIGWQTEEFQTPYDELAELLVKLDLPHGATLVDLGAGYARLGIVTTLLRPDLKFIGYELVPERVEEGRRILATLARPHVPARLEVADLASSEFTPAAADVYFVFDYGRRESVSKTLNDLRLLARLRPITVAARGGLSRNLIEREHPWLCEVHAPRHLERSSIYRSS